jgi:hypothetical protein
MKLALVISILFFSTCACASAQTQTATDAPAPAPAAQMTPPPAGCGPADETFDVTINKKEPPNTAPVPNPAKALVYFVQDDQFFTSHPHPVVKWGVDGAWVGATQTKSYFHLWLEPGVHHLCSEWQSKVTLTQAPKIAVAHFTAQAGKIYYFRAQNVYWKQTAEAAMTLDPTSSDEGALLATRAGYSIFTPRK